MHLRQTAWRSAAPLLFLLAACGGGMDPMNQQELEVFASRYASAWSSQNPERFAAFYTEDAVFRVNDGEPAVGRTAIAATAASYMEAFPDMAIEKVSVSFRDGVATFHWHWTGTNRGPGGTGREVDLKGYEEWTFGRGGLIARCQGHMDQAEYDRQMGVEP
jgi:uncharacterized protein (TIGR02246 family)